MSDNNGLWAAARYGNIVVLRFMLSRGVDINSADSYGKTALIRASHGGHIQAVNLLLEHGAEVNRTDKYKQTALMCAIKQSLNCWEQRERYNETVKALVSAGADMHLRDAQGRTALLLAAMEGSTEAVMTLVEHGSEVNTKDYYVGSTPVEYALLRDLPDMVSVLRSAGAVLPVPDDLCASLFSNDDKTARRAVALLTKLGKEAVGPLIQVLDTGNTRACQFASEALVRIGDIRAFDVLVYALQGSDCSLRHRAACALANSGDNRAFEPLLVILNDEDAYLRQCAAEAMITIGNHRAVEALCKLLDDELSGIQSYAVQALANIGDDRCVLPLCQALRHDFIRQRVVKALGEFKDARAVRPLIQVLGCNELFACVDAVEALVNIGEPSIGPLRDSLHNLNPRVREYASAALKRLERQEKRKK